VARIPETELERLKREVSLERLVEAKGVKLERRGADNLVGRCPWHDDSTPSLVVSPKKNVWNCLGACRRGGTVIDWVMLSEGVSFRHAVELLRNGVPLSEGAGPKHTRVPKLPSPVEAAADDAKLLRQVVDYYHRRLKETPAALEYLKKRGLQSAAAVEHFKLGFADRSLGLRLPPAQRSDGELIRGRLQQLGIFRESGHEHLAGSLVVPIIESGEVRGMYGRKVTHNLRPGTPLHLYLPGPHKGVFNEAGLKGQRAVIVCEALLDALTFWVAGFPNVTSAYGVEGFTPLHLEALKRHRVEDVLIAFDRDDAGDAGAEALGQRLTAEGFKCWRVQFPRGLDVNSFALGQQSAAKALSTMLRQAAFMDIAGVKPKLRAVPALSPLVAEPATAASSSPAPEPPAPSSEPPVAAAPSSSVAPVAGSTAVEVVAVVAPASSAAPAASTEVGLAVEKISPAVEAAGDEHVLHFGPRRYRVRGLSKNPSPESLKVNLLAGTQDAFHVDTFDLYQAKARAHFIASAAVELRVDAEVVKRDVGQLLLKLEALQEQALKAAAAPAAPTLTEVEREAALELLRAPSLLERVLQDFEKCGVVGEETNKLVGYLAAVSRKLEEPLAVLIQSSSAAGKSSLMEAVLAFVPDEDKVKYSAMTGQSLFYMGDADLKHKVLAVVEEEGAARASYALKLLQSEGELTIASTGKNPSTGRLETHEYHVEGPTQLFLTTTASELDEELLNRCLVLSVDEERAQTAAIHRLQREKQTLEGLLARRAREATLKLHQNAQRLLRPLLVANPFARQLTFLDDRTRTRRDFPKYLTLIRALALLHQYQRPVKSAQHDGDVVEYIEATLEDVAMANRLAAAVLGRSLDELPPQTRRLLGQLEAYAKARAVELKSERGDVWFTRKELRASLRAGDTQLFLHLTRLVHLEHLQAQRGERGVLHYRLAPEGSASAAPVLSGLASVEGLKAYDGQDSEMSGRIRGAFGPRPRTLGRGKCEARSSFSRELARIRGNRARAFASQRRRCHNARRARGAAVSQGGRPRLKVGGPLSSVRVKRAARKVRLPVEHLKLRAAEPPESVRGTMAKYLEALAVANQTPATLHTTARNLCLFADWCEERALSSPAEVTRPILERYQRHLFYYRKANGSPLSVERQLTLLSHVKGFFRWATKQNFLLANPAADLELPKKPMRLPKYTLSVADVEKVLAHCDVTTLIGLRDRAVLEVLWATGIRRAELASLKLWDVQWEHRTVFVRQGKGQKDRVVPISERALSWVRRYIEEVRPRYAMSPDSGTLFLCDSGEAFSGPGLTVTVSELVRGASVEVKGACHLFRHACATQMLEGGADIRFVQELLGHASLTTTQVYTRVSIAKLKAVYGATHPAARAPDTELLGSLEQEAKDEASELER